MCSWTFSKKLNRAEILDCASHTTLRLECDILQQTWFRCVPGQDQQVASFADAHTCVLDLTATLIQAAAAAISGGLLIA